YEEATIIKNAVNWALMNGITTNDLKSEEEPSTCSKVGDMLAWYVEEKGAVSIRKESTKLSLNCII
ncbi:MAG: hypothetical protein AAF789_09790, partial [Bacteroidota bacterium]